MTKAGDVEDFRDLLRIDTTCAEALCDDQVLPHGQLMHRLGHLERPAKADARPFVDGQADQIVPGEGEFPLRRPHETGDSVEQRGLARAVRTDEADHLLLRQREADIGYGDEPAEGDGNPLKREHGCLPW